MAAPTAAEEAHLRDYFHTFSHVDWAREQLSESECVAAYIPIFGVPDGIAGYVLGFRALCVAASVV